MYNNIIEKKIIGPFDDKIEKVKLSGTVNSENSADKVILVYDRITAGLIGSVNADRITGHWEIIVPYRSDETLTVICRDEGGDFNADIYDRLSLCSNTFTHTIDYDSLIISDKKYKELFTDSANIPNQISTIPSEIIEHDFKGEVTNIDFGENGIPILKDLNDVDISPNYLNIKDGMSINSDSLIVEKIKDDVIKLIGLSPNIYAKSDIFNDGSDIFTMQPIDGNIIDTSGNIDNIQNFSYKIIDGINGSKCLSSGYNGLVTGNNASINTGFNFSSGEYTISFWINSDGWYSTNVGQSFVQNMSIDFRTNLAGTTYIRTGNGNSWNTTRTFLMGTNFYLNKWNHIAISISNSLLTFYVNGSKHSSIADNGITNTTKISSSGGLIIDGGYNNYGIFQKLSNFRIFNRTITDNEAIILYNENANICNVNSIYKHTLSNSELKFNTLKVEVPYVDIPLNNSFGDLNNIINLTNSGIESKSDSILFDGNNTIHTLKLSSDESVGGDIGDESNIDIYCRFKPSVLSGKQVIWKSGGSNDGIAVGINGLNAGLFGVSGATETSIEVPHDLISDSWYKILCKNGEVTLISDNGVPIISELGSVISGNGTEQQSVGGACVGSPMTPESSGSLDFFNGEVSDIEVFTGGTSNIESTSKLKIAAEIGETGVECEIEIEKWEPLSNECIIWVKIPELSSIEDNIIRFYFYEDHIDNTNVLFTGIEPTLPIDATQNEIDLRNALELDTVIEYSEITSVNNIPWTPAEISTALWLDASDASTITLATGVSNWADKSGNGNDAVQASGTLQPLVSTADMNGLDTISFDGSDDILSTALSMPDSHTVFYVAKKGNQTTTGSISRPVIGIDSPTLTYGARREPLTELDFVIGLTRIAVIDNSWIDGSSVILSATYNGTTLSGWYDGNVYGTIADTQSSFSAINIGGDTLSAERKFKGTIAEVIICNSVLSDADRQKIEGYLAWKWGLQADLQTDHQYKDAAPVISFSWDQRKKIHITNVLPTSANDDFTGTDGDAPNELRWLAQSASPTGFLQINNNKLRFEIPITANDENMYVKSNFKIGDNFDIQVDFYDIVSDPPSSSGSYPAMFRISIASGYALIGTQINSSNQRYMVILDSGGTSEFQPDYTNPTKFRFVRSGSTIKAYYWSGTQWEWNNNTSGKTLAFSSPDSVAVTLQSTADFNSGCTTDWDNFVVNSGTVVWPELTDFQLPLQISSNLPISVNDYFTGANGDAPNDILWSALKYDPVSVTQTATNVLDTNRLKFSINNTQELTFISSKFKLIGDFDIQVDFETNASNSSLYWSAAMTVCDEDEPSINTNIWGFIGRYSGSAGPYRIQTYNVSAVIGGSIDSSGKLRLVRSGSTLTGYFLNGSSWTSLSSDSSFGTANVYVKLFVRTWNSDLIHTVYYDNFVVNSGTVVWPGEIPTYGGSGITGFDASAVFDELKPKYNAKPWKQQYSFNITQSADITGWTTGTSLPGVLYASQAIVTKNRVYLLGGFTTNSVSTVYTAPINEDGTLGTWTTGTSLPGVLRTSQAIVTKNRVYLLGGFATDSVYTAPINEDGTLGTWTTGTSLPGVLYASQAIVTKNRVYLLGGFTTDSVSTVYTAPINEDGTLGTWTTGTSLPGVLRFSQAIVTKNRVYLLGGLTTNSVSTVYTATFAGGFNDYSDENRDAPYKRIALEVGDTGTECLIEIPSNGWDAVNKTAMILATIPSFTPDTVLNFYYDLLHADNPNVTDVDQLPVPPTDPYELAVYNEAFDNNLLEFLYILNLLPGWENGNAIYLKIPSLFVLENMTNFKIPIILKNSSGTTSYDFSDWFKNMMINSLVIGENISKYNFGSLNDGFSIFNSDLINFDRNHATLEKSAINFTGNTSEKLQFPENSRSLFASYQMSISFWINPKNITANRAILGTTYYNEISVSYISNQSIIFYFGYSTSYYNSIQSPQNSIQKDMWTHVVYVRNYNNTNQQIYINGELSISNSCVRYPGIGTLPIYLGYNTHYSNSFIGKISDFKIFNKSLLSDDVKSLYKFNRNISEIDPIITTLFNSTNIEFPFLLGEELNNISISADINDQNIHIAFTNDNKTYYIFNNIWLEISSKDPIIHGNVDDNTWYYKDENNNWIKSFDNANDSLSRAFSIDNNSISISNLSSIGNDEFNLLFDNSTGIFDIAVGIESIDIGETPTINKIIFNNKYFWGSKIFDLTGYSNEFTTTNVKWNYNSKNNITNFKVYAIKTGDISWTECTINGGALPMSIDPSNVENIHIQFKIEFDIIESFDVEDINIDFKLI
jgi:hypothetical protein